MAEAARARLDADGRLTEADERLLALNARAGGRVGAPLAVPQLAALARLALNLGVPVARPVIAAEGDHDLDLSVSARRDGDGVALTVGGWSERPRRAPWLIAPLAPAPPSPAAASGVWNWATDAALRLTALDGDPALIGEPLTRLVRLIEDADGDLPILTAIASGSDFAGQPAVRRDDPAIEVTLSGTALRDANGRFAGFAGRAEGVAPPAEEAPAPDRPVDADFARRLDRALREPLNRIIAGADGIAARAEGDLSDDYAAYGADIAAAARHLLALVDDLGDLQTVESDHLALDIEPIDLADLARRAGGLLAVRAADRGVSIDRPGRDDTVPAQGDFRRVLQILVNLVGNAVRFAPPGSAVWLRGERDGDRAVMVVADQGRGIAPEEQARIFEKFARVDPAEPGGSGLGLYIARRLARAMGGDITVDSAPGQGARFVLSLPAA